jgi:hypothetical protein
LLIFAILNWTSGYWTPIASQAAIQTLQAMNRVVQIAGAGVQTDRPDFTEWAVRPTFQFNDDEDEADEGDGIQWSEKQGANIDRL